MRRATAVGNSKMLALFSAIATGITEPDQPGQVWPGEEKVRQAYSDLVAWDRWLDSNRRAMPPDELQLHELTLRWAKGVVKSWRIQLATGRDVRPGNQ